MKVSLLIYSLVCVFRMLGRELECFLKVRSGGFG